MLYFFVSLVFVNLFLYYSNYFFLFPLLVSLYFLGKRANLKLYIICCLVVVVFFSFNLNCYKLEITSYNISEVLTVLENYENYSIVGDEKKKYLIYNNENEFREGNKVLFEGRLEDIRNSYKSFYNYLNKKNVCFKLEYHNFYVIDPSVKTNEMIVDKLLVNKSEKSKSYLKLILFNVKDENNSFFYDNFSLYSLTYLIAVSGFHINLLLSFFKKVFRNNFIGIGIVSFYLYLLDFSVSSYRAFLCYVFKKVNKILGFSLSNLEVISLIGSVFILKDPSLMFSFSFIYSFLATFVLEIFKLYKGKKVTVMFYIYLVNIPLLLVNYYKLNLSSLLFSLVLSVPVSFLYVFSFMFLFLDKFYLIYEMVIGLFYRLFNVLNKFNFILVFGKPSFIFIVIYYLILISFFVFKERKSKLRFVCMLSLFLLVGYQYYKPIITYSEQIYFLNVGQGDCTVLFIPHSKEVVLVDTGGSNYKDIASNEIIPFLESKGINKINKVVLTHDDFDHIGALDSLKRNFIVKEIVDNSLIKEIKVGDKIFKNLNVSERRDNDGSIVLYGKYAGYDLLLMGDASLQVEDKILKEISNVDIIKIGHHGSNTSSGYEFLDRVNGRVAIISVGENNMYGHPHKEVIENLEKLGYVIFRTDENDNIGFGKKIFNLAFVDYFS